MKKTLVLSAAALLMPVLAQAQAQALTMSPWRTFASVGYSSGGDVLVNGVYSNTGEQFTLRAGKGLQATVGASYALAEGWSAQAALGYHVDRTNGSNFNFTFSRWPVELMLYRELNSDWRIGAGLRYSAAARFESSGTRQRLGTRKLSASVGPMLDLQYFLVPLKESGQGRGAAGGVGLKWVSEKFHGNEVSRFERDGQHLALYAFAYY